MTILAFQKRYSLKNVLIVTAVLCVVLIALQFLVLMLMPNQEEELRKMLTRRTLVSHVLVFIFFSFFFYFTANGYYSLVAKRKTAASYFPITFIAVLIYAGYESFVLFLSPEKTNRPDVTFGLIIFSVVITAICMTAVALLIAYLTSLRDEQKQRKVLEKQKMELEVENSQANFNFLKAQINPHFLHNTLNFLYAKALPLSAELSEGILCLSDIMRYALNEGKNEKSMLRDEIEHLENVIKINQFRFSNNLNVQFEVKGETGNVMIVPFVLITLVENAFKHGDLKNREFPIIIRIIVDGKRLYFYCCNKKNPGFKEISTGIGLQNILKRLDIMYGDQYSYKIHNDESFYSTELIINTL